MADALPHATPPRVTVVIPNYNGRELLATLLPTLAVQDTAHDVVVVDDCSSDASVAYLSSDWPRVRVIVNEVNRGFAVTANRGIAAASTEYIALVNTDVELEPSWLGLLVAALDAHPAAGSASGKSLSSADRTVLDGAGHTMSWSGAANRRGFGEPDRGQYDEPGPVISACAGYALYRRSAFEAIGTFDASYIAYYEDVDWGLRAQFAGYDCWYEPRAVAYHAGGATHGVSPRFERLRQRNQLVTVLKNYPARTLLRRGPEVAIAQFVLILRGLARTGAGRTVQLAAIGDAVRAWPAIRRERRVLRTQRRRTAAALEPLMTPTPAAAILGRVLHR